MTTRNPNNPVAADYAKFAATIEATERSVRIDNPPLAARERQAKAKPRPGSDDSVALILQLGRQHGIQLPGTSADEVEARFARFRGAQVALGAARSLVQALEDEIIRSGSIYWSGATFYYSVMRRYAATDPKLTQQMAPLKAFFAQQSPEVRAARSVVRAERMAERIRQKVELADKAVEAAKARREAAARNRSKAEVPKTATDRGPQSNDDGGSPAPVLLTSGTNGVSKGANGVNGHA